MDVSINCLNKWFILLSTLFRVAERSLLHCYGETITSPPITNWGEWGEMEKCPEGTFVVGFQLKTEPNQGSFRDDTAGNAIRLYCGDPIYPDTPSILSSEGHLGNWGGIFRCPQGAYINGFALRVEAQTLLDNTATNNFRFYCNHQEGFYIEGDGLNFGQWRENGIVKCNSANGVLCGLQTQVHPPQSGIGDNTSLNNLSAECCNLPDVTSPTNSTTTSEPPTTTEEPSTSTVETTIPIITTTAVTTTAQSTTTSTGVTQTTALVCDQETGFLKNIVECPPHEGGVPTYYPYPYDCRKFIECSNGIPTVQCCPSGTVWDQDLTVCNHEAITPCVIVTTPLPTALPL